MSAPVVVRGVRMVKITTFPVQYDPSSNVYLRYDHILADVVFTDDEPINPVLTPERKHKSPEFLKFIDAFVVNPEDVPRDVPNVMDPYIGHICVVTHTSGLQFAAPWIEWRRRAGYKVDIISVSDNDARANPPNNVKAALQALYNTYIQAGKEPFDHVLLIGDRSSYADPPAVGWQLNAEAGTTLWGGANHADYKYGLLEGNDDLPDVGFGRWPCGSQATIELAVGRTLAYEMTPHMDNPAWFTRGLVYSQHWGNGDNTAWHITIHTNTRWAAEVLEKLGFDDIKWEENYAWDQYGANGVGPKIRDALNAPSNICTGRAENYYFVKNRGNHNFDQEVQANVAFPINMTTSGHGEWAAECMFRTGSGQSLKGWVGTTNGWGGPPTAPMSGTWMGLTQGFLLQDMSFGWAYAYAITNIERLFPQFNFSNRDVFGIVRTDTDIFGDPSLKWWHGIPRVVNAAYPAVLSPSTRMLEVKVTEQNGAIMTAGAFVSLYHPKGRPAFGHANYPAYADMLAWTTTTDENGIARFIFPENAGFDVNADLQVTVTGRDIRPFLGIIDIANPNVQLELGGYNLTETEGNENGEVNPGELFSLALTAKQVGGNGAVQNLTGTVISASRWVSVEQNNVVNFADINAGQSANGDREVLLTISPACPDGASSPADKPIVVVEFTNGQTKWRSAVQLAVKAPNFNVKAVVGGIVMPLDQAIIDLDIDVKNIGLVNADVVEASLKSVGFGVSVLRRTANYPAIRAGQNATIQGDKFQIAVNNKTVVPGTRNEMVMIFTTAEGFRDSAYFDLQLGVSNRTTYPQGPDKYGYICFDDTDVAWDMAPKYNWIEISTAEQARNYNGTSCNFDGAADHQYNYGQSKVFDLGFETQFYGYTYDKITISTCGYIAMGDQGKVVNYQNWPMDQCIGGGVGMIAPFWDKLKFQNGTQVYYHHDKDSARFIVEWYKFRHFTNGQKDLIFQVILYDKDVWVTPTGDTPLIIQYKSVADAENVGGGGAGVSGDQVNVNEIPYASVGVSSPDGNTGLNYLFRNTHHTNSAALQDRRVLKYVTSPKFKTGVLYGTVSAHSDGSPIADADVVTSFGQAIQTDENGFFRLENALAEMVFNLTFGAKGFNDSTLLELVIPEDDSLEFNVELLNPDCRLSIDNFRTSLEVDDTITTDFTLSNVGNGTLNWSLQRRLPGNADVDPWERRESIPIGQIVGSSRVQGVIYVDGKYICSVGAPSAQEPNYIMTIEEVEPDSYKVDKFPQPCSSRLGFYDLGWDGRLIWAVDNDTVYGFTVEGDVESKFKVEGSYFRGVAWDTDRELLWICSRVAATGLYAYDREGRQVHKLGNINLNKPTLAYWPDDPEGMPLYLFHDREGIMTVHKMNPETKDTAFVTSYEPEEGGLPEGAFITNSYDVFSWVFITVVNGTDVAVRHPDRIDLLQLEARREWFKVYKPDNLDSEVRSGFLNAGESLDLLLMMNSTKLPNVVFNGEVVFHHNAIDLEDIIEVELEVFGEEPPADFKLLEPMDEAVVNVNDSSEVRFVWEPTVDRNKADTIKYLFYMSTQDSTALIAELDTVGLLVDILAFPWEEHNLPPPEDSLTTVSWWVTAVSGEDTVVCEESREFTYVQWTEEVGHPALPVQFGLNAIYPSPFNGVTTIRYGADRAERLAIRVFDITGRLVTTLTDGSAKIGTHTLVWNASSLSSGVYVIRLESGGRVHTVKTALVK